MLRPIIRLAIIPMIGNFEVTKRIRRDDPGPTQADIQGMLWQDSIGDNNRN